MRATSIIIAAAAFALTVNASAIFKRQQDAEACSKSLSAASSSIVTFSEIPFEISPENLSDQEASFAIIYSQLNSAVQKVQENCCNPPSSDTDGKQLAAQILRLRLTLQVQHRYLISVGVDDRGVTLTNLTVLEKAIDGIYACLDSKAP